MIRLSGASDDLVEIDGDEVDEIDAYDQDVIFWFNDGSIIRMTYGSDDDAAWHGKIELQGMSGITVRKLIVRDDYYSDELSIDAKIVRWERVQIGGWADG